MVRRQTHQSETRVRYVSENSRTVIMPKKVFQRFVDYTTEADERAAREEKNAAKMAALKKATYEKSMAWDTKIQNIKAKRREELLSKRRKDEEERKVFVEESTKEKAIERAEVVKQARKLVLQKKPLCRRINQALLTSEHLRELDAQVALQKTLKTIDKEQDVEYANSIKLNVAKYEEERKQEIEEREKKARNYGTDLEKQIKENKLNNEIKATEELEMGKQDQRNMAMDVQLMKENEMQNILSKKKKLQQFFKEAIDEKKRFELQLKHEEELEVRALDLYQKAKHRIEEIHKSVILKEKEERAHHRHLTAEHYRAIPQTRQIQEQENFKKAVAEKEAAEAERQKIQKERKKAMHVLMDEYKLQDGIARTRQRQEEKDFKVWQMMQRFKRDEYNKQTILEERKRQWSQKQEYGNELRKNATEKQMEQKYEKAREMDATDMKAMIENANRKILLYGKEVLNESEGVRPLYPILKAIEECKKEMGLTLRKKVEKNVVVERPRRKHGVRRICTKPVPADQINYLQ